MINTLPFFLDDFENAVEEVFGQSPSQLSEVADVFEVMAYHQILRKRSELGRRNRDGCQATERQDHCLHYPRQCSLFTWHACQSRSQDHTDY